MLPDPYRLVRGVDHTRQTWEMDGRGKVAVLSKGERLTGSCCVVLGAECRRRKSLLEENATPAASD